MSLDLDGAVFLESVCCEFGDFGVLLYRSVDLNIEKASDDCFDIGSCALDSYIFVGFVCDSGIVTSWSCIVGYLDKVLEFFALMWWYSEVFG